MGILDTAAAALRSFALRLDSGGRAPAVFVPEAPPRAARADAAREDGCCTIPEGIAEIAARPLMATGRKVNKTQVAELREMGLAFLRRRIVGDVVEARD